MQGFYDRIVLAYFVACGVSRLARYNVTAEELSEGGDKVKYFEGTPIPTSLLLVAMMFAAAWQGALGESLWFGQVVIAGLALHPLVIVLRGLRLAHDQPDTDAEALNVGESPGIPFPLSPGARGNAARGTG